jgi:hypothetical protein
MNVYRVLYWVIIDVSEEQWNSSVRQGHIEGEGQSLVFIYKYF